MNKETLKQQLINENPQFKQLAIQHKAYDRELTTLSSYKFLSSEEQLRETELKKMKLKCKDQMEVMLNEYLRSQ